MGDFLKEFVKQLYPWHIHTIGGLLVVGLGVFLWFTFWGVHKYTDAFAKILGRDDRIKELQEAIDAEKEMSKSKSLIADQTTSALFNVKSFVETLNNI